MSLQNLFRFRFWSSVQTAAVSTSTDVDAEKGTMEDASESAENISTTG